jgi:hypothetical protein
MARTRGAAGSEGALAAGDAEAGAIGSAGVEAIADAACAGLAEGGAGSGGAVEAGVGGAPAPQAAEKRRRAAAVADRTEGIVVIYVRQRSPAGKLLQVVA